MEQDRRPAYVRLLAKVIGLVGRGAPLPLLAMVVVSLGVMGTNVLVFHLLEAVLSQLTDPERLSEIVGAILVAGVVILIRELLEMVADPIATYVFGKTSAVLTEAMNQKVERLEVIDFETLDANERLELAKAGDHGGDLHADGLSVPCLPDDVLCDSSDLSPFTVSPVVPGRSPHVFCLALRVISFEEVVTISLSERRCRCSGSFSIWSAA